MPRFARRTTIATVAECATVALNFPPAEAYELRGETGAAVRHQKNWKRVRRVEAGQLCEQFQIIQRLGHSETVMASGLLEVARMLADDEYVLGCRHSRNDQGVDCDTFLANQERIDVDRFDEVAGCGDYSLQSDQRAHRERKRVVGAFQP